MAVGGCDILWVSVRDFPHYSLKTLDANSTVCSAPLPSCATALSSSHPCRASHTLETGAKTDGNSDHAGMRKCRIIRRDASTWSRAFPGTESLEDVSRMIHLFDPFSLAIIQLHSSDDNALHRSSIHHLREPGKRSSSTSQR